MQGDMSWNTHVAHLHKSILLYCSAAHSKCTVTICIELTRLFRTSQFRSIEKGFYRENKCCVENSSGSGNISQLGLANQHTFICSKKNKIKSLADLNCVPISITFGGVRVAWHLMRQVTAPHAAGWVAGARHRSRTQLITGKKTRV